MEKNIAENRRARFDYEILETLETGIVLSGVEVKAIRNHKINLSGSYGRIIWSGCKPELWLVGMHIGIVNEDPTKSRKLLVHRNEISRLIGKVQEKGLTLVPLTFYFKRGIGKVLLGLGKGRKVYDKRDRIKEREARRELRKRKF